MEAIKAIAKRTKTGKYKIDLPINNNDQEVEVMVIEEQAKIKSKKTVEDFAGKIKTNIDWLAYQKEMSGNKVILDTNAVGAYLENKDFSKKYLKNFDIIEISVVSQIEYLSNPNLSPKNKSLFEEFIDLIEIHPVSNQNKTLVTQTISIRKKYKLKLPDALIAATAIINNATLISAYDAFSKIFNLKFQLIKP